MVLLGTITSEFYQFLFISSIIFMGWILGDLFIKMYGRFKLKEDTRFTLTVFDKIALWVSVGIFLSYLIK